MGSHYGEWAMFPRDENSQSEGMNAREYIATVVLAQLAPHAIVGTEEKTARQAVAYADALLKVLAE